MVTNEQYIGNAKGLIGLTSNILFCCTYLREQLGQACMQMLILQFVSTEDGFDLGGGGGLAAESHHPQRGGHHHGRDEDVLCVFLLCHVVVEATSESQERLFAYLSF